MLNAVIGSDGWQQIRDVYSRYCELSGYRGCLKHLDRTLGQLIHQSTFVLGVDRFISLGDKYNRIERNPAYYLYQADGLALIPYELVYGCRRPFSGTIIPVHQRRIIVEGVMAAIHGEPNPRIEDRQFQAGVCVGGVFHRVTSAWKYIVLFVRMRRQLEPQTEEWLGSL